MSDYPVLKIRADGPTGAQISEISLDGKPLTSVVSFTLTSVADDWTRVTLVLDVIPDVEMPVEVSAPDEQEQQPVGDHAASA